MVEAGVDRDNSRVELRVAPGDVVVLDRALDGDLPVAGVFSAPMPTEANVREIVVADQRVERCDVLLERPRRTVDIDEQQIMPNADSDGTQVEAGRVDAGLGARPFAPDARRAHELALQVVGPGVPRASQGGRALARRLQHPHGAVAADVVESAHFAVAPAHQHEGPAGEVGGHGVARIGDIAREADGAPQSREQAALLEREELGAVGASGETDGLARRPIQGREVALIQEVGERRSRHSPRKASTTDCWKARTLASQ